MKKIIAILLGSVLVLASCTKKESVRTSGIDTIDNTTYFTTTYYNFGFQFAKAGQVSTNVNPGPDITIYVINENGSPRLTLQSNNLKPSFYKAGDYNDATSAQAAFDNLTTVNATQWLDMADPIAANQVWIYRSGNNSYAKIRIISTISEKRDNLDYGECTFQWVYQPDGSSTFPAK